MGTPLEDITKLHKDLAMALATMTGDVEIEAPIPGMSLVAIRVPYEKQHYEARLKGHAIWKESQPKDDEKVELPEVARPEFPKTFRDYLAVIFYIIAGVLDITVVYLRKLGNYIEGRDRQF